MIFELKYKRIFANYQIIAKIRLYLKNSKYIYFEYTNIFLMYINILY